MTFGARRAGTAPPAAALALAAVLALVSIPDAAGQREQPMRSEHVVQMLVRGVSTSEILEEIRSRPAEFDVSPEIQDELRLAGVPDEVIEAMVARMAELAPPPETEESEPAAEPADTTPVLRILLAPPASGGVPSVRLDDTVDSRLREAWQLDASAEGTPFEDLAVYVACLAATHVPDHWRGKSPLGRDFISMPRHRMLSFISAGEQFDDEGDAGALTLELPSSLEVDLEPGEPHDLSLGLAVQAAGRYFRWVDDVWEGLSLEPGGTELRAEIRGNPEGRIDALEVRFDRSAPSPPGD